MKKSDIDASRVIKLYKEGVSTYTIAEEFNTYPNMINRILKKHGERLRDKSEAQSESLKSGVSKHPTKGKKRPDSFKLILSKKGRDRWKELDEKEKQRRIDIAKTRWDLMSQEKKDELCKKANEAVRLTSKEGSQLEKFLLSELPKKGFLCQHHRHIIENDKMEVDIFIPSLRICIEIDGPSHFLPIWGEDKLKKVMESDSKKNGLILGNGFVLIRIKCKNDITIIGQYELIQSLLDIINNIDNSFPKNISDRYIEIDF